MEPWYKIVEPRKEVREGRAFNPDECAIALDQVVAKTAPEDYRDPRQFFARTCWTRALREHAGMVLRRLSGETVNTSPVMTLITQFGGGKTHTLTALYHMVTNGAKAAEYSGVANLISEAGIKSVPEAKVAVFVGNAWDPQDGRETPWIDVARQLAGDAGGRELGAAARTTPPGTESLARVFEAAGGPVAAALRRGAELPESSSWHGRPVPRIHPEPDRGHDRHNARRSHHQPAAQPGRNDRLGHAVAGQDYQGRPPGGQGPHCQRRDGDQRGRAPPSVRGHRQRPHSQERLEEICGLVLRAAGATAAGMDGRGQRRHGGQGREFLRGRFEACYPFHRDAVVFQRKWQALSQYQQTRGTLAMLAQWISWGTGRVHRGQKRAASSAPAPRRWKCRSSAALCWGRLVNPGSWPPLIRTFQARSPMPGHSMRTPREPCGTSIAAWERRFSSSLPAGR